jgi:polyisoprenoid-binding protein YceI
MTPGLRRRLAVAAAALVALIALAYGGVWFYATVINDAPDALDAEDLDAALSATTSTAPAGDSVPATSADIDDGYADAYAVDVATTTTGAGPATSISDPGESPAVEGGWLTTDGSLVGYRVAEVLFGVDTEGVGRTEAVTGTLTLDGTVLTAVGFSVDVATMTSDDGRRDNQFRGRIMSTDEFPTATFTLTDPVDLGVEAVEGATVSAEIVGDLTLRGVTRQVTATVEARVDDGRIGVVGSIPVVFTDFEIVDPSLPGIVVEPDGLVEFVLVFVPA